jgi:hypothetical protein
MVDDRADGVFRFEQVDEAGVLGVDDLDDLEGIVFASGHAACPVDSGLRADAELLDDAVIGNFNRHLPAARVLSCTFQKNCPPKPTIK